MTTLCAGRLKSPAHNGNGRIVRAELARAGVPLSVYKLQLATGLKPEKVRAALSALMAAGGVISARGPKGIAFYSIWKAPRARITAVADGQFKTAAPIRIGRGSLWGAGLV